jgi:orotate phosphoribosyltransferase
VKIQMKKEEIAKSIYDLAHITGEFNLRSGQISNEYFDKYLFEAQPELLVQIARIMKGMIPENIDLLAGLEMGGIPVATALSIESGISCAFVRKKAKEYGTCKLAEGADVYGRKVCVVEDVVTTGGQIIENVKELRSRGALIDTVLCVIQRDDKAAEILAVENLKLLPAFTMEYIKDHAKG